MAPRARGSVIRTLNSRIRGLGVFHDGNVARPRAGRPTHPLWLDDGAPGAWLFDLLDRCARHSWRAAPADLAGAWLVHRRAVRPAGSTHDVVRAGGAVRPRPHASLRAARGAPRFSR